MKGKIVSSYWEPESGIASVTKATKFGEFSGQAVCQEIDADIMNEWDGYAIAEFSCDIQAMKERLKQMHMKLLGMEELQSHSSSDLSSVKKYYDMKKAQYLREKKKFQEMVNNKNVIVEQWLSEKRNFREQHS